MSCAAYEIAESSSSQVELTITGLSHLTHPTAKEVQHHRQHPAKLYLLLSAPHQFPHNKVPASPGNCTPDVKILGQAPA